MSGKAPQPSGNPPLEQPCCFNCTYLAWLIGVGQGLRCMNPGNKDNPDLKHQGFAPLVPSRTFTCGLFEAKKR